MSQRPKTALNSLLAFFVATRARGRVFVNCISERSDRTTSGSMRLREVRAFRIQRGGMFARNFRKPRTTEPALEEKSFASLGIKSHSPLSSPPRRLGYTRPRRFLEPFGERRRETSSSPK